MKGTINLFLILILTSSCGKGLNDGGADVATTTLCPGNNNISLGVENGVFGPNQIFDVQRSPAYPSQGASFTVSNFATPLDDTMASYTLGADEYIQLFKVGGDITQNGETGCKVGIRHYTPGSGSQVIAAEGGIWGINGDEGFLFVSAAGIGTFVSTSEGFSNGDSLTYTPVSTIASCEGLDDLKVSTVILSSGETVDTCNN